jgi:modulator of FtsH protease HflK
VAEVLLTGHSALPAWLAARLPDRLAPHRLGLVVLRASVDYLAAPSEVRDAFDAVARAQTGIQTHENQALQRAAARVREAETVRFQCVQQAEAYRRERRAVAAADADTFTRRLDVFQKLKATNPNAQTAIWWAEVGRALLGMRDRGRIDLLDSHLGPNGLDLTQFVTPKK